MKTATVGFALVFGMLSLGAVMAAPEQKTVRVAIQAPADRKPAPAFRLLNASGKARGNADYRGKIVLLDFWATECGGAARVEIPWFVDLEKSYMHKGLSVVGVSMDVLYENLKGPDEAWNRVKPFVEARKINYPILMGEDRVTKAYDIQALPATYLIDRRGRIAATYIGLVDKSDVETNILTLFKERR